MFCVLATQATTSFCLKPNAGPLVLTALSLAFLAIFVIYIILINKERQIRLFETEKKMPSSYLGVFLIKLITSLVFIPQCTM